MHSVRRRVGKRCRLQLYQYPKGHKSVPGNVEVSYPAAGY